MELSDKCASVEMVGAPDNVQTIDNVNVPGFTLIRAEIAPPVNRQEYVSYRVAEAVSFLGDNPSRAAVEAVVDTIVTRLSQFGHNVLGYYSSNASQE